MTSYLNGKQVLITREKSQAAHFSKEIKKFNGQPLIVPLIRIVTRNNSENEAILSNLDKFDWIFFTSINGVIYFFNQLNDHSKINDKKIAVVGHKTRDALMTFGFDAHFMPTVYNAETMAEEFVTTYGKADNILFVRGNISRPSLLERFTKEGISYSKIIVYDTRTNIDADKMLKAIDYSELDYLTFTSPSTVKAFVDLIDKDLLNQYRTLPCICSGTTTEREAKSHNFVETYDPEIFTIESMIDKMIELTHMEAY